MRWGLIPFWAKDLSIGGRMINARAETVAEKALVPRRIQTQALPRPRRRLLRVAAHAVRQATHARRHAVGRTPSPSRVSGLCGRTPKDNSDTDMRHHHDFGKRVTQAHPPPHARYPAQETWRAFWLDRSIEDPSALSSVLTPYPDAAMEAYEVSTFVNSVANDGP